MGSVRRLTWLLMGLFLSLAFYSLRPEPPVYLHANQPFPEIVAPAGDFLEVFDAARPATLRVESRSPFFAGRPIGVGTGFFISPDGFILTANHVVDTSSSNLRSEVKQSIEYIGVAPDGTEFKLDVVGFDAYQDLSLLKAEITGEVPYLPVASSIAQIGTDVIAIGNSGGDFLEGRAGRISRLGVDSPQARFAGGTIELTAALSPGDSGGPVINAQGEAIGVVSYISYRPDAIGADTDRSIPDNLRSFIYPRPDFAAYAIPVVADSEILASLMAGERRDIPVIGFGIAGTYVPGRGGPDAPNLGPRPGTVVGSVQPGGPADLAGILSPTVEGQATTGADVIVAVDDEPTPDQARLIAVLYEKEVGQEVTVSVQRGDNLFKVRLTLGAKQDVFR